MPLTNRPGLFAASESSRVYVTLVFVVSAFFEMKTRPVVVAAHSVARIRSGARDGCHGSARSSRSTVVCSACRQIRRTSWADLDEVTTSRIRTGSRELGTVRFEECLVAGPILGPPDAQRAFEDRSRSLGMGSAMMGA